MIIRAATNDDLDAMVRLGEWFARESGHDDLFDAVSVYETIARLIDAGQFVVVIEHEGELVGGMLGVVERMWMNANHRCGFVIAWNVRHKVRGWVGIRMLRQFQQWARARGAVSLSVPWVPTMDQRTARVLERNGYRVGEANYVCTLE
jgi:hypothetical protein